jgi:D-alanine-D-alanine ligase
MKIAVLATLKEDAPISPEEPPGRWDDLDDRITVDAILASLRGFGFESEFFPTGPSLVQNLQEYAPDLCFNTGEGHYGASRESQTPAILDMMRIPYTGAGPLGMSLSHNKHIAKKIFRFSGLPTAGFTVITDPAKINDTDLRYPLFVKPAHEGSSIGINDHAVVHTRSELENQVKWVWNTVHSPVLVEEYIQGREFTIGVIGNDPLPVVEVVSPTGFYSNRLKESENSGVYRLCPAPLPEEKTLELQNLAVRAMRALELYDWCRMDVRMDDNGQPFILEVNPMPLIYPDPEQASFLFAARATGLTYAEMINKIVLSAIYRLGLPIPVPLTALVY